MLILAWAIVLSTIMVCATFINWYNKDDKSKQDIESKAAGTLIGWLLIGFVFISFLELLK